VIDNASATAAVIAHAEELGLERVVGDRLAFLNIDEVVLASGMLEVLPPARVVLEILETVPATDTVLGQIAALKARGYRFALDDIVAADEGTRALAEFSDVLKIDISAIPPESLAGVIQDMGSGGKRLLAEKVETQAQFEDCLALGFHYFQGYFFARPLILTGKKLAPSELALLNLLSLLNSDADTAEIELAVKRDGVVSMNLLRLVNTPASGASRTVSSVSQAVMVLGRAQLQRWIQILLYAQGGQPRMDSPLLQLATRRGKLIELLVRQLGHGRDAGETGFTVGLLSLMHTLYGVPMTEVLERIAVDPAVRLALLERKGELGVLLRAVELAEESASPCLQLRAILKVLGMRSETLFELEAQAFEWVMGLSRELAA